MAEGDDAFREDGRDEDTTAEYLSSPPPPKEVANIAHSPLSEWNAASNME